MVHVTGNVVRLVVRRLGLRAGRRTPRASLVCEGPILLAAMPQTQPKNLVGRLDGRGFFGRQCLAGRPGVAEEARTRGVATPVFTGCAFDVTDATAGGSTLRLGTTEVNREKDVAAIRRAREGIRRWMKVSHSSSGLCV